MEVPRREIDLESSELAEEQLLEENDYSEFSSAADRSANCCRLMALIVSFSLQMRKKERIFFSVIEFKNSLCVEKIG